MAYRDFYNILGIPKGASQDEIKKAYRTLARQWHPDRNPGDEVTVQRFKDITEAYNTLGDPENRARYDRLGPLYTEDGRPPRPEDFNDAVGAVFGNLFRRKRRAQRGDDLRYTLSLTLEEVALGVDRDITVPRRAKCGTCGGDGATSSGKRTCTFCDGSGQTRGSRIFRGECYHCKGKGFLVAEPCDTCSGEGSRATEDSLRVTVPAGVATGQKLKLAGKGNASSGSGEPGDLFVIVNVAEHPLFRRRGEDVLVELPLAFQDLALGTEVDVPTLDGVTTIRVPAGTTPGRIFRLAGRGLPRLGRSTRGDLHLEVVLDVPVELSAASKATLDTWARALPSDAHPRRAAFQAAVQERR